MHKYIEAFILQKGYEDLTSLGQQAKTMAQKVIEKGLTPIEEYYGSEVTLFYPGLFAGTTDLVCRHNDMDTVVDFKQANQPKRKEWIDDYYMQIAAYAMAHDYLHGSKIEQGIIMVCTPDLYLQEFRFQGVELRDWKYKFLKRLSEYYEMIKEPSIDEKELLAQFEDSKIKEGK
jgi:genome maintenance exonuclease 1